MPLDFPELLFAFLAASRRSSLVLQCSEASGRFALVEQSRAPSPGTGNADLLVMGIKGWSVESLPSAWWTSRDPLPSVSPSCNAEALS